MTMGREMEVTTQQAKVMTNLPSAETVNKITTSRNRNSRHQGEKRAVNKTLNKQTTQETATNVEKPIQDSTTKRVKLKEKSAITATTKSSIESLSIEKIQQR